MSSKGAFFDFSPFSDMLPEEKEQMKGGEAIIDPAAHENFKQTQKGRNLSSSDSEVRSVNWKEAGKVTEARWQGFYCNASWAISAVTVLESMQAIKSDTSPPVKLSEQEALDCTS